ncbi:hypothetical protein [Nocardioides sp.]|uniref:hypothetical protein n=1 Tax=Nocardioides sp. TaxID=35761 RepID=UPI00356532F4
MPGSERLLAGHADAAWLPPGDRADVVPAGPDPQLPSPVCVVRLLVTRGREVLTVSRADGRGLDLPMVTVDGNEVAECVQDLVIGATSPGTWLGAGAASAELGERHWWPLATHVPGW